MPTNEVTLVAGIPVPGDASEQVFPWPDGTEVFYQPSNVNTLTAITEQINKQLQISTVRDAQKNVPQLDGSITTVEMGEASLIIRYGDLIEGAATNGLTNPDLTGGGSTPTSWGWLGSGISSPVVSTLNPNAVAYLHTADAERPALAQTISVLANTVYSLTVYIEEISAGVTAENFIAAQIRPTGSSVTYPPCSANPSGGNNSEVIAGRLCIELTIASTAGTYQFRCGLGCSFTSTGISRFSRPQHEDGPVSSYIGSTGGPAFRDADDTTFDAVIKTGLLLENAANSTVISMLSSRSGGAWTYGVNISGRKLDFNTGHAGTQPKYTGVVDSTWIGKPLYSTKNSSVIEITGITTIGIVADFEIIRGTEAEVQAGFQYDGVNDNPFNINHNRGDYSVATMEADVRALRVAAGDTDVWAAVQRYPVNNFSLPRKFEYRGLHSGTNPALTSLYFDASNEFSVLMNSANLKQLILRHKVGGVTKDATIAFTNDIEYGDSIEYTPSLSSTTGTTLVAENVTQSEVATPATDATATADISMPAICMEGRNSAGEHVNIALKEASLT